jgi:PAS domain S-box-containing protein
MQAPSAAALAVLEHASDAVFILTDEFTIDWVNEMAATLLGYERAQLVGRNIAELIPADELAVAPLRRAELNNGRLLLVERTLLRSDGVRLRCEVSSGRLPDGRLLGLARDVTARTEAARRLQRSEESFRMLSENLPDAIAIHRGGKFVFCNRAMVATLGYTREAELLGMSIMDVVHPESRPDVTPRVAALAAGNGDLPWLEERILRRDGSSLTMEIASIQIEFQEGPAYVVVGRDVTERKALQRRLADADRMASVGTLAAGIAHEINNPLTYVALNLESVQRTLRGLAAQGGVLAAAAAGELCDKVSAAIEGTDRVSEIVTGLRRFARADASPRGPIDVARAIEAAVRLIDHELRLRARLVREQRAIHSVLANEGRLTQVLVNVLSNAAHAIPEGQADRHTITIRSWDEGDDVCISVTDTGAGIAPELVPRVFDPFFTTKDPGSGVGLGLSICHGIVTGYGGTIDVASVHGHGTTFTVRLPAAADEATSPIVLTSTAAVRPPDARLRVLVIDDEAMIRKVVRQVLGGDYDVEPIASGRAAIERLAQPGDIDLVLCDLSMPDVSGADVYKWVEAHRPELTDRMVFSSGADHPMAARFPERWLDKPFGVDQLQAVVARRIAATRRG